MRLMSAKAEADGAGGLAVYKKAHAWQVALHSVVFILRFNSQGVVKQAIVSSSSRGSQPAASSDTSKL